MGIKEAPRIIVLMYHRINRKDTDPWGICVSPEHFDEQITLIKKRFPFITADKAIQQVISRDIPETSVCITFDDGYEDNYTHALPVLKTHNCPAAFFIATAFTGSRIPFWWDELEIICLHSKQLPDKLQLSLNGNFHDFSFENILTEKNWQQHHKWLWYEKPPTLRCDSFLKIWNLLRFFSYNEIEKKMSVIRSWANADIHSRLPMNENQLQTIGLEKLVTLGLHTHMHLDLASQTGDVQAEDIRTNQNRLAGQYNIKSSVLAYPYGSFADTTLSVVKKLSLKGCFTTESAPLTIHSDLTKLSRYQAFNWNTDEFEKQLLKWIPV